MIIKVLVEVPTKLSKEQRKDIEKLDKDVDLKQCERMKKYADNVESLYGKKPFDKK